MPFIRRAALGCTALLVLLLSSLTGNPAVAAEPDVSTAQVTPGTLVIRTAKDPNLVVDLAYGSPTPGTPVTLYPLHGGDNQRWEVVPIQGDWFMLRNKASGTCLVNGYHSVDNGHKLAGYGCNPGYEDQLWARVNIEGTDEFTLINKYSGKCMDQTITGTTLTQITQWECHGQTQQRWTATPV
jgi:hypothetical protein